METVGQVADNWRLKSIKERLSHGEMLFAHEVQILLTDKERKMDEQRGNATAEQAENAIRAANPRNRRQTVSLVLALKPGQEPYDFFEHKTRHVTGGYNALRGFFEDIGYTVTAQEMRIEEIE